MINVRQVNEVNEKKFYTRGLDYEVEFNNNVSDVQGVKNVLPWIRKAFDQLIECVADGIPAHNQVRSILHTNQLENPTTSIFMRRDQLSGERFLSRIPHP